MLRTLVFGCFTLSAFATGCASGMRGGMRDGESSAQVAPAPQVPDPYDATRNPQEDLRVALGQARGHGKGVLLIIGGMWCRWCKELEGFLDRSPELEVSIRRRLVVVRVHYSREVENEDFLMRFPTFPGCPHFFVLDSEGSLVLSQDTSELELGDSYSVQAFQRFVDRVGCSLDIE